MTTKLDKPLTRELQLRYKNRPVLVTLIPGDPATGAVEAIEFRLKGTQQSIRRSTEDVFRSSLRAAITGERK